MDTLKKIITWVIIIGGGAYLIIHNEIVVNFILDNFIVDTSVNIPESNAYARDYEYVSFSYDEDFKPEKMSDYKNIIFNIFNGGYDTFSFFCPRYYEKCIPDLKEITGNQATITMINNYVSPFNSFSTINTTITTIGTTNEITYEIRKLYSASDVEAVNNQLDKIIGELNISSYASTSDKIRVFHDYLISHVDYDNERARSGESMYKSNTAYGALIEGKAICSGYADALAIFLDRLDVPNFKISEEEHIWNMVYINNSWLHIDVTWDDVNNPISKYNYFLISTKKLLELDKTTHNFDKSFYLEASN